jgi:hypothetical protein
MEHRKQVVEQWAKLLFEAWSALISVSPVLRNLIFKKLLLSK